MKNFTNVCIYTTVYDKIRYGDRVRHNPKKNRKKQQKTGEKSQNHLKNMLFCIISTANTFQITHIRTAAVQPPIYVKIMKNFTMSMGVHRYEKLII